MSNYIVKTLFTFSGRIYKGDAFESFPLLFFKKDFIYLFDRQRSQVGREGHGDGSGKGWEQAPC